MTGMAMHSLKARLFLISFLSGVAVVSALVWNSVRLIQSQLQTQIEARIRDKQMAFQPSVAMRLAARDYASLREIVELWRKDINSQQTYIVVTDENEKPLALSGWPAGKALPPVGQADGVLNVAFPVYLEDHIYGYVHYGFDIRFIEKARRELLWQGILIGLVGMILFALALSIPVCYLTRNLGMLARASARIRQQHFSHRIQVRGRDEIAQVAESFNGMADELERLILSIKEKEEHFRAIADYTYSWENWFGVDGRLRWTNPAVERIVGYTPEECSRMPDFPLPLVYPDDQEQICFQMKLAGEGHSGQDLEFRVIARDGRCIWVAMSWQPIRDSDGAPLGYRSSIRDITQQHQADEELVYQAEHDYLTGLCNRRTFERQLQAALKAVKPTDQSIVVLYIDLDQFKLVNDSCGHMTGDRLLIDLAQILRDCVAEYSDGFLARLGGDEFGVLLTDRDESAAMRCARHIIEKVRTHIFTFNDRSFRLGVSIGVARARPGEMTDFTELLIAADTACYAAKEHGRNRAELYVCNNTYFQQRSEEFRSIGQVMDALQKGRFILYFQRMQMLLPGLKSHAEILLRLKDADDQIQAPARFIEAAERFNLMPYIDRWVLENTCRQLAEWQRAGIDCGIECFAINVSGSSLSEADFPDFVQSQIDSHGVDPRRLCFEITESYAVGQLDTALRFIERMHALGAELALDDFGSGLSSFGYLKRFKVDYLKIDGMFVKNLDNDVTDRAVVATMVQLAHVYGLKTIVEFVHNNAVLEISNALGCAYAQGYACHVPEPLQNLGLPRRTKEKT
ncbi:MAG: EAL domain-containing protein [Zoogloeaceae bacterium]|jgi:diguanylate cyclase (GGDEF)-like protein/PAS domain S-box-containing protein|nr:EAL domain-containing protein [Zoogloeaceae bacterium]